MTARMVKEAALILFLPPHYRGPRGSNTPDKPANTAGELFPARDTCTPLETVATPSHAFTPCQHASNATAPKRMKAGLNIFAGHWFPRLGVNLDFCPIICDMHLRTCKISRQTSTHLTAPLS